jgi:FHS family L-fucose permease-like MFS transporter
MRGVFASIRMRLDIPARIGTTARKPAVDRALGRTFTMALMPSAASSTDPYPVEDDGAHIDAPELRLFVMALFFIFGGITSLNDVIIPKLKELFTLNYMQAMLIQSAFFAAYAIIGIPGAALVKRVG